MESRGGREQERKGECRCAEGKGRGQEEREDAEGGHSCPCHRQPRGTRGVHGPGRGRRGPPGAGRPRRESRVCARIPPMSVGWGAALPPPRLRPGARGSPPPSLGAAAVPEVMGMEGACGEGVQRDPEKPVT